MAEQRGQGDRLGDRLPGFAERAGPRGATGVEIAGAVLALAWLGLTTLYSVTREPAPEVLPTLLVVTLPVAVIWVAVVATRSARDVRAETARLGAAVDALRQAYLAQSQAQSGRADTAGGALNKKLDEIAATQASIETRLTMIASGQIAEGGMGGGSWGAHDPDPSDDQPSLSLGTSSADMAPPLANSDFIRALHFPETAEDAEGFAALRRALQDRQSAQLIQAAQDVLTLVSQDGIYMDDLSPDLARPEVWRAFARGARGREVAPLGGVHDRAALALTAGRMKQDPIFRDAVHHFLRRFDKTFATFEPEASDAEISAFASTRTARAFMLLGRVAGTFD